MPTEPRPRHRLSAGRHPSGGRTRASAPCPLIPASAPATWAAHQHPIEPVVTSSGLVVRALASSNDLVAFTPKTQQAWVSVWRAHPGGSLITLNVFGDVIVATTSNRQAVAYDAGRGAAVDAATRRAGRNRSGPGRR